VIPDKSRPSANRQLPDDLVHRRDNGARPLGFYLFIVICLSLAGFGPLHNRCQPLPRIAQVHGTPAKPDDNFRSKACLHEGRGFEENVASSTPRRAIVTEHQLRALAITLTIRSDMRKVVAQPEQISDE
jgi:hypothetical protein